MAFAQMTIGRRLGSGFALVLGLLLALLLVAFLGVEGVVGDAREVIAGNRLDSNLTQREVDHLMWANALGLDLLKPDTKKVSVQEDCTKCAFGVWLYGPERKQAEAEAPALAPLLKRIEEPHRQLHDTATLIGQDLAKGERTQAMAVYQDKTLPALAQVQGLLKELRQEARRHILSDQGMLDNASGLKLKVSLLGGAALVLGVILAWFIARGIGRALRALALQLRQGAEQVASASNQVAAASQSLAQGASEQAGSLEETSASLEEISSMVRTNAEAAAEANGLVDASRQTVGQAVESMANLRQAMHRIEQASQQTAAIIKTIDEIAFQTNLLALNAAVEAARAGEAGAGFAVVAGEVRSLAQRAAEAAKNTQEIIETNLDNIQQGGRLVAATDAAFAGVAAGITQVADLVARIAAASNEQTQGISQINSAVQEMDRVTQTNASGAEESAAAAEELSGQARSLHDTVEYLRQLVGGDRQGRSDGRRLIGRPPRAQSPALDDPLSPPRLPA